MKLKQFIILSMMMIWTNLIAVHPVDISQFNTGLNVNKQLPRVFIIADNEYAFEALSERYNTSLMEVCDNEIKIAYNHWTGLMQAIEAYADSTNFNIKGSKMWIKIFWDKKGNIDYIAYFLKPNSRNINEKALSNFFTSFIETYKLSVDTNKRFSHYGSTAFPTFSRTQEQLTTKVKSPE